MNIDKKTAIVYHIPCATCDKGYIGNTGREFNQRMKEHAYAIKSSNLSNSICLHKRDVGHVPNFEKSTILHFEKYTKPRFNLESLEILASKNVLINHIIPENTPLIEWTRILDAVGK